MFCYSHSLAPPVDTTTSGRIISRANPDWLARLITRRLPPEEWPAGLKKRMEDIKVIVDMTIAT